MGRASTPRRQKLTKTPTAAVIIALWNRADITARFLSQLKPYMDEVHQLSAVDDCSKDRTPQVLEWWRSRLKDKMVVVRNHRHNRGYGPSINRGVKLTTSDIVIVMNNDIEIRGSFIIPTIEKLMEQPRSIVTARIIDWDGGWNTFGDLTIPYAEGWYLATWRGIWSELKGFDERFAPCDYDDVDLSYRAVKAGIQLVELELPIEHVRGVTLNQLEREKLTQRSRRRFAKKWGFELDQES